MRVANASILFIALPFSLPVARPAETLEQGREVRITSPGDGARPQSAYLALTGIAPPLARLEVSVDGSRKGSAQADDSGAWEKVIRTGDGPHRIGVRLTDSSSVEATIRITNQAREKPPRVDAPYESLRLADIVLSHSVGSEQDVLYSPTFTHSALFVGGDEDGAPLVAEPVDETFNDGPTMLRMVAVDTSMAYNAGRYVRVVRPVSLPAPAERSAIATWARQAIADGARFWSARDFGLLYRAWTMWDASKNRPVDEPRFLRVLAALDELKNARDRFNCATLVWRAYLQGAGQDIAAPNLATGYPGAPPEVAAFFRRLQPHLVTPDILYGSGKLAVVN